MQVKVKPLVVAMSLILTACSSGNSSDPAAVAPASVPQTTSLRGIVSDGYISGATVCLDVNENSGCDVGEPAGTSGANGAYDLSVPAGTDTQHSLLAVVEPTSAQDADGRNFNYKVIYSAPAGQGQVISPISTLVHHKIKNDSVTLELAKEQIANDLGTSVPATELLTDYVAAEKTELEAQSVTETKYRDLHRAAQLLTTVIGEELDKAYVASNYNANEGAIYDLVMQKMPATTTQNPETLIAKVKGKVTSAEGQPNADFMGLTELDLEHWDTTDDRYLNIIAEIAAYEAEHSGSENSACIESKSNDHDSGSEGSEGSEGCTVTPITAPTTPTPTPTPNATVGKGLYATNCSGCHGANPANNINKISSAVSAAATRSAINSNTGGMSFLSSLSDAQLQDIAAYVKSPI